MKQNRETPKAIQRNALAMCRQCEKCSRRLNAAAKTKADKRTEPKSLYGAEALIYDFYFSL